MSANEKEERYTARPPRPKIEIVKPASPSTFTIGPSDPRASETEIGLWDRAVERRPDGGSRFLNEDDEKRNLVGGDARRFYIRVTDPNAKGRKYLKDNVEWWTSFQRSDSRTKTQDDPRSKLSLFEVGTKTGVFVSKGLMIVNDAADRDTTSIDSGIPKEHPLFKDHGRIRTDQQSNYRLRRGGMFSWVVASYLPDRAKTPVTGAPVPVFDGNTRLLPIQVYIVRTRVGGKPSVDPLEVFTDLRVVTETYERIRLWTFTVVSAQDQANEHIQVIDAPPTVLPYRACLIDPIPNLDTSKVGDEAMRVLAKAYPGEPDTIRLFYIGKFASTEYVGMANPEHLGGADSEVDVISAKKPLTPPPYQVGACFIDGDRRDPYTAAHEIGHVLTDKGTKGGHYEEPPQPTTLLWELNLMSPPPIYKNQDPKDRRAQSFHATKRIWDVMQTDLSGPPFNQMARMFRSRFTR